jgi:hypothetical protein
MGLRPADASDHPTGLVVVAILAVGLGVVVGLAPSRWDVLLGLAALVVAATAVGAFWRDPMPRRPARTRLGGPQVLALTAMYLVLASTLTFRQRSADELAENPLDLAGQFRVTALVAAFGLACLAMMLQRLSTRGLPTAGRWYLGYVAVVPLGLAEAVSISLVLFRWVELLAFVTVWLALILSFHSRVAVPLRHFGIFVGAVLVAVGVGVLLFPDQALIPVDSVIPFQLRGSQPQLSGNDVGTLGAIVFAYGIGRSRLSPALMATGAAIVLAAQYRTGYVAILAMVTVVLVIRRGAGARVALVALAVLLPILIQTSTLVDIWVRGDSASLATLTGRTVWWGEAIEVASRSSLVGIGLSSGVRYEVLQAQFNGFTSTIHSTWVEAYVGTGLIGVTLLAVAFVAAFASAWSRASRDAVLLPLVLITLLGVKSVTSSSIEIGGLLLMMFLLALTEAAARNEGDAPALRFRSVVRE